MAISSQSSPWVLTQLASRSLHHIAAPIQYLDLSFPLRRRQTFETLLGILLHLHDFRTGPVLVRLGKQGDLTVDFGALSVVFCNECTLRRTQLSGLLESSDTGFGVRGWG